MALLGSATASRASFDYSSWTDQQLVFATPETRHEAFAELFVRHSKSVGAVARMVLGSAAWGSDDIVAEVFAELWRAPERFEPDRGSLLTFLRVCARGRSLDLLRSESNRRRRERNSEPCTGAFAEIGARFSPDGRDLDVRRAVEELPVAERTPIELAYFVGMSYRAVAHRLDLPEGTVKSRIRSGLRRLAAKLDRANGMRVSTPREVDDHIADLRIRSSA